MVRPKRLIVVLLAAILLIAGGVAGRAEDDPTLAALRAAFRRPAAVPFPADNAFSEDKRALGEVLFRDRRLSGRGDFSCADCHDPARNFTDGKPRAVGVSKRPLGRHTPALWNLAFSGTLFWDGRARTLEEQVAGPLTSPDEMGGTIDRAVAAMAADLAMVAGFVRAFPERPVVSRRTGAGWVRPEGAVRDA